MLWENYLIFSKKKKWNSLSMTIPTDVPFPSFCLQINDCGKNKTTTIQNTAKQHLHPCRIQENPKDIGHVKNVYNGGLILQHLYTLPTFRIKTCFSIWSFKTKSKKQVPFLCNCLTWIPYEVLNTCYICLQTRNLMALISTPAMRCA